MMCNSTGDMVVRSGAPAVPPSLLGTMLWWQLGSFINSRCTQPLSASAVPLGDVVDIVLTAYSKDA
eukprot:6327-Amphidinium_carterae.1